MKSHEYFLPLFNLPCDRLFTLSRVTYLTKVPFSQLSIAFNLLNNEHLEFLDFSNVVYVLIFPVKDYHFLLSRISSI